MRICRTAWQLANDAAAQDELRLFKRQLYLLRRRGISKLAATLMLDPEVQGALAAYGAEQGDQQDGKESSLHAGWLFCTFAAGCTAAVAGYVAGYVEGYSKGYVAAAGAQLS
ncbi:hypothetical protein FOA52_013768 [Chlamydomonas sp. UWO 241]|nr:hypothetical protein FOA52_013768 [Chlamydomonas sp. UWO 241]